MWSDMRSVVARAAGPPKVAAQRGSHDGADEVW